MDFDQPPVVRAAAREDHGLPPTAWPRTIPAVEQILREGLALATGVTFLAVLRRRFDSPGFYCLDEPEAALSFSSTLGLIAALHDVVAAGEQVLCAPHSPVLAAMPGATILEVGPWGMRRATRDEIDLVAHWRAYLAEPHRYLRHIIDDDVSRG